MSSHGSWQTVIISDCGEDENIMNSCMLLCLRESICLLTEPLWTVIMCSFSGTIQQISGMRLITRVFLGLFLSGTVILIFDPHQPFGTNFDPEMPILKIQEYQVHLPMEAIAVSTQIKEMVQQNSACTQMEKEILRFYVTGASSLTSSDSIPAKRSGNESTKTKKDHKKKFMKGDSANTEGGSSSAEFF